MATSDLKNWSYCAVLLSFFLCAWQPGLCIALDSLGTSHQRQALACLSGGDRSGFERHFGQAKAHFQKSDDLQGWFDLHKAAGKALRGEGEVENAILYFRSGYEPEPWRTPEQPEEWDALIWLHVNLGYTYLHHQNEYRLAQSAYEQAYRLFQAHFEEEDYYTVQYIYCPLANLYTRFGDFETARQLLRRSHRFFEQAAAYSAAARILNDLALAEEVAGEHEAAVAHLRQGLSYPELSARDRAMLHINLGKLLHGLGQYRPALASTEQAARFLSEVDGMPEALFSEWTSTVLHLRSNIELALGQTTAARQHLAQAETQLRQVKGEGQRRALAKLLLSKGKLLEEARDYCNSVMAYQEAIACLMPGFRPADWDEHPSLSDYFAENTFVEALSGKAQSLYRWQQAEGGKGKLEAALESHAHIFQVEQLLRRTYHYESAKLFNVAEAQRRSAQAISIALALWEQTGEPKYKEQAFAFAERSKSTLLLEAFHKSKAELSAGVPRSVLDRERELQGQAAAQEEALFQLHAAEAADSAVQAAAAQLLHLKQAYAAWMDTVEARYPAYYQLKHELKLIPASAVPARILKEGQTLIEYFLSPEQSYVFVLSAGRLDVLPLPSTDKLAEQVLAMKAAIEGFQHPNADRALACQTYRDLAYSLYQQLIGPLESLGLASEQLLIVPSGVLGLLPFDALLTEAAGHCQFERYPYLLKRYEISYAYSATLQATLLERPVQRGPGLAFAPAFDGANGHAPLKYNQRLAEGVAGRTGGRALLGPDATIAQLRAEAAAHSNFHFASHAQANVENSNFSFIVFSDGQGGYDSLFVKDIYLLPLQADMVVLSGCETFVGKLYQGEGVINLARSFLQAGANSVIATLWPINDDANARVMETFYERLSAGDSKSAALRAAKQQQIEAGGRVGAHPVYWAAFTGLGDMNGNRRLNWKWWAFGASLMVAFGVRLFLRKPWANA